MNNLNKIVLTGDEARAKLIEGANAVADAVKATLGPRGHTVVIEQEQNSPHITKDGVSVAKAIKFRDRQKNLGARMLQDVAAKAAEHAGDGTTTATVLAQAILNEGYKLMSNAQNPNSIRRGIVKAVDRAVELIKDYSQPIENDNEIKAIATLSANGDEHIGELISDVMSKVGRDGVITIDSSNNTETKAEVVEGMKFKKGYLSPYFVTDQSKMVAEYNDANILITDKRINSVHHILPILQTTIQEGLPLVIIADDIDDQVITQFVVNRIKAGLKILAVKAPGYGDRKLEYLKDIACIAGCKVISDELGTKLETTTMADLGKIHYIKSTKDETIISGNNNGSEEVKKRCDEIRALIENATMEYDKEKYRERLGALSSGVAVLKIGGATETEVKERKDRADDALCATRAAVEEGIVPGGGTTLLRISKSLNKIKKLLSDDNEEILGIDLISRALSKPFKQILSNAGEEVTEIQNKVLSNKNYWYGYNAKTNEYGNLRDCGVIDPAKVTRCALQDAASIASLILTTDVIITTDPEDDKFIEQ